MTPAPPVRAPRQRALDWGRASATLWGYGPRVAHRVPDLQLDLLVVYRDHARAELDADGQIVHWLEALVRELQEQARLPDTGVADDDVPARMQGGLRDAASEAVCVPFSASDNDTARRAHDRQATRPGYAQKSFHHQSGAPGKAGFELRCSWAKRT